MAEPLAAFQGTALYLDTVLLVGFLDSQSPWHPAARQFLYRAVEATPPIRLVTATLTIDEIVFVLLEELVKRPPHSISRSRGRFLRAHPATVRELMDPIDSHLQRLLALITLESVRPDDIMEMRGIIRASGILPRDAIHLAVMRRLGITAIASDDDDFDQFPDITLYKP